MLPLLDATYLSLGSDISSHTIGFNESIRFNNAFYITEPFIELNTINGDITINTPGYYVINWWIAVKNTDLATPIIFTLMTFKNSELLYYQYPSTNAFIMGQIQGNSIIKINANDCPTKIRINNVSCDLNGNCSSVLLPLDAQYLAGITIYPIIESITGATGATGPQGDIGPIGPTGLQGVTGVQGIQGITGPQGDIGPIGPTGLQGVTGVQGIQGITGPQGNIGPIGPTGPKGVTGEKGVPAKITIFNSSIYNPLLVTIPVSSPLNYNNVSTNSYLNYNGITSPSTISIDSNGYITILSTGLYNFTFTLNLLNPLNAPILCFDIVPVINGIIAPFITMAHCEFSQTETFIVGELSIDILSPTTIAIINSSSTAIQLPIIPAFKGILKITGYSLN